MVSSAILNELLPHSQCNRSVTPRCQRRCFSWQKSMSEALRRRRRWISVVVQNAIYRCNICNMKYLQFMQYTQYASGSSKCNTLVSSPPGIVAPGNCTLHNYTMHIEIQMHECSRNRALQMDKHTNVHAFKHVSVRAHETEHMRKSTNMHKNMCMCVSTHPQLDGLSSGSRFG